MAGWKKDMYILFFWNTSSQIIPTSHCYVSKNRKTNTPHEKWKTYLSHHVWCITSIIWNKNKPLASRCPAKTQGPHLGEVHLQQPIHLRRETQHLTRFFKLWPLERTHKFWLFGAEKRELKFCETVNQFGSLWRSWDILMFSRFSIGFFRGEKMSKTDGILKHVPIERLPKIQGVMFFSQPKLPALLTRNCHTFVLLNPPKWVI